METLAHTGDVTHLQVAELPWADEERPGGGPCGDEALPPYAVLVGRGGLLLALDPWSRRSLLQLEPFWDTGARVHGAAWHAAGDWAVLAVHGDGDVAAYVIRPAGGALEASELLRRPRSGGFVLTALADLVRPGLARVAVARADHSVDRWFVRASARSDRVGAGGVSGGGFEAGAVHHSRVMGWAKCLLYSASLLADPLDPTRLLVAAGTIFGDVLLWAWPAAGDADEGGDGGSRSSGAEGSAAPSAPPTARRPERYRLWGHEGSVHRVVWRRDGTALASASDDRTVRLWRLPAGAFRAAPASHPGDAAADPLPEAGGPRATRPAGWLTEAAELEGAKEAADVEASCTFRGHGGKVLDVAWRPGAGRDRGRPPDCSGQASSGGGYGLVSVGQDGRLMAWEPGSETEAVLGPAADVPAHMGGRGAWRCACSPDGLLALTGGADGAVRTWRLRDWLEADSPAPRGRAVDGPGAGGKAGKVTSLTWASEVALLAGTALGGVFLGRVLEGRAGGRAQPGVRWATYRPPEEALPLLPASVWREVLPPRSAGAPVVSLAAQGSPQTPGSVDLAACDYGGGIRVALGIDLGDPDDEGRAPERASGRAPVSAVLPPCLAPAHGALLFPPFQPFASSPRLAPGQQGKATAAFWARSRAAGASLRVLLVADDGGGLAVYVFDQGATPLLPTPPPRLTSSDAPASPGPTPPTAACRLQTPWRLRVTAADAAVMLDAEGAPRGVVAAGDADGHVACWEISRGEVIRSVTLQGGHRPSTSRLVGVIPDDPPSLFLSDGNRGDPAVSPSPFTRAQNPTDAAPTRSLLASVAVRSAACDGRVLESRPCPDGTARVVKADRVPGASGVLIAPWALGGRAWEAGAGPSSTRARVAVGFSQSHVVVSDVEQQAQVARLRQGGIRRPCCSWARSPDDLAVAWAGDGGVRVASRAPGPAPAHSLLPALGARETHAVALVDGGDLGDADAPVFLLAGGEDGLLRALPLAAGGGGAPEGGRGFGDAGGFGEAAEPSTSTLGSSQGGGAIRALATIPVAGGCLVFAGGAKSTLEAWLVGPDGAGGLRSRWAGAHEPAVLRGRRGNAGRVSSATAGAEVAPRVMALACWRSARPTADPAALPPLPTHASSSGEVILFATRADGSNALLATAAVPGSPHLAWREAGRPAAERSGVLLCCEHLRHRGADLALAGCSHGGLYVWAWADSLGEGGRTMPGGPSAASPTPGPASPAPAAPILPPAARLDGIHPLGTNAVAAAARPDGRLVVIAAGDDGAASVCELVAAGPDGDARRPLYTLTRLSLVRAAHSSSIRDFWTDGRLALSVGLDQRLRSWKVAEGPQREEPEDTGVPAPLALVEAGPAKVLWTPEPAGLAVRRSKRGRLVGVCGYGVQALAWRT